MRAGGDPPRRLLRVEGVVDQQLDDAAGDRHSGGNVAASGNVQLEACQASHLAGGVLVAVGRQPRGQQRRGLDPGLVAVAAQLCDGVYRAADGGLGVPIEARRVGLGIGRGSEEGIGTAGTAGRLGARHERPHLFGHVGHDRMQQAQHPVERE